MIEKNTITFANGNRAVVITAPQDENAKAILDTLGITSPRAVILLFGGAKGLDESRKARLAELFIDGIAPAAADLGAIVIDGGTQAGVMAMMGEAVARRPGACELLGIAPAGKVTYAGRSKQPIDEDGAPLEPNHSRFVLVDSNEWGGETETIFEIARAFNAPTVAILVNGGPVAADEALRTVRNGWPLLVFEGSGRFADELSAATRDGQSAKSVEVTEIARSGRVSLFHVDDAASTLKIQLRRMIVDSR